MRGLIITAVCFAVIVITYGVYASINNSKPEASIVHYTGSVGSFSVNFTRFTDYDTFLKAKSSDIIIYNDKKEMINPPRQGFIAGEVEFHGNIEFKNCKLELIRASGWNTSATPMNMVPDKLPDKEHPDFLPFMASDFNDSSRNVYKTAIIRFEGTEVVIPLTES